MLKIIKDISTDFQSITLNKMNSVKLMNRVDCKYILNRSLLPLVLKNITNDYSILDIDSEKVFPYSTLYFDTDNNYMYLAHHNGKMNRCKIRFRKYISSNLCFLEIKNKYKGNRTIKNRLQFDDIETNLSDKSKKYIEKHSPFQNIALYPKIFTNFSRITLVNKALAERVTIDLNLSFQYNGYKQALENVVIIEIKRDTATYVSSLTNTLNYYHVFPQGFSKYCIGRALVEKNLKHNNFKERIITINKINDGKYYYHNFSQH